MSQMEAEAEAVGKRGPEPIEEEDNTKDSEVLVRRLLPHKLLRLLLTVYRSAIWVTCRYRTTADVHF